MAQRPHLPTGPTVAFGRPMQHNATKCNNFRGVSKTNASSVSGKAGGFVLLFCVQLRPGAAFGDSSQFVRAKSKRGHDSFRGRRVRVELDAIGGMGVSPELFF